MICLNLWNSAIILNLFYFIYGHEIVVYSAILYNDKAGNTPISSLPNPLLNKIIGLMEKRKIIHKDENFTQFYDTVTDKIQNVRNEADSQAVVIHSMNDSNANILITNHKCSYHAFYLDAYKQSEEYWNNKQKFMPAMRNITTLMGKKDIVTLEEIEKLYFKTQNEELSSLNMDNYTEAVCYSISVSTATRKLARLKAGPLLNDIFTRLNQVLKSKTNITIEVYRLNMYGIIGILNALDIYDYRCPEDYSAIFVEVYKQKKEFYIRITSSVPDEIVWLIPTCGHLCTVEKFLKIYEDLVPVDWKEECLGNVPLDFTAIIIIVTCTFYSTIGILILLQLYYCVTFYNVPAKNKKEMGTASTQTVKYMLQTIIETDENLVEPDDEN